MSRNLFGIGTHGGIIGDIQRALAGAECDPDNIDEVYGQGTVAAVERLQFNHGLPQTGEVDDTTWGTLMSRPIPSLFEHSLELTAAFEGHSYDLAMGDFDGAWLTWGSIGFTMKFGRVQESVLKCNEDYPELIQQALGDNSNQVVEIMRGTPERQKQWADSISINCRLAAPWRQQFQAMGEFSAVRQIQRQLAHDEFYVPCLTTAGTFGLRSELAIALCFDIYVQNGSINSVAQSSIHDQLADNLAPDQQTLPRIIANAVADAANAAFREDVRARKMAIATGTGVVHGATFNLESWGLGEFAADTATLTQASAA